MLHEFVAQTEILYSKAVMTFNVHLLLHLAKSVRDWDPLWAHNAFAFESGNGYLLKVIHAAKGVHHQICRRMSLKSNMIYLFSNFYLDCSSSVNHYYDNVGKKWKRNHSKLIM